MKDKKIYWIDDTAGQHVKFPGKSAQSAFQGELGCELIIRKFSNSAEFNDFLSSTALSTEKVSAVIMDYQLSHADNGSQGKKTAYGTTWATQLRAEYPDIPIFGVSQTQESEIPKFRSENYLFFYPRDRLLSDIPWDELESIISGYRSLVSIRQVKLSSTRIKSLIESISPPPAIEELLIQSLPDQIRIDWDSETPHLLGRWFLHEFIRRPGFLIDRLELETMLGLKGGELKSEAWQTLCKSFDAVEYKGLFSSRTEQRWWGSAITVAVEGILNESINTPIATRREDLLKAIFGKSRKSWLSIPYAASEQSLIPDCVAFKDDSREERVQCMYEHTQIDAADLNPPFGFRSQRIFIGESQND